MKNKVFLIIILALILSVVLVWLGMKKQEETFDPAYKFSYDVRNNLSFYYHQDYQISSTAGYIRLTAADADAAPQSILAKLSPTTEDLKDVVSGQSLKVGDKELKVYYKESKYKTEEGKEYTVSNSYYLWEISGRKVLFETTPGIIGEMQEKVSKFIESFKVN